MDMAISIGNSNIRVATNFGNSLQTWQTPAKVDDIDNELESIFSMSEEPINRCIISSVKPELTDVVYKTIRPHSRSNPIIASLESGFLLDYSNYKGLLGIDRAICCEAACLLQQPPFIMIDFGTATTINVVDDKRHFVGGIILPSIQMGLSALSDNTALLPHVDLHPVAPLLGLNTEECILSGAIWGTALLLDNAIVRICEKTGMNGKTVITGGNAPIIMSAMRTTCQHEENLIIKGLFAILDRNREVS